MSFQKIENCKLRVNDCSSRRTKYYYHPSKCPRSWPNYKACFKALGKEHSLSRISSRDLQTYPRLTNDENPPPKLRENPGSLNIIVTEDTRKTLRMRHSRTNNRYNVVSSSSDDSLKYAFLNNYKYPKKGPKHLSVQQIMGISESRNKGKNEFAMPRTNYSDNYCARFLQNANEYPEKKPRGYTNTRDIYKSKTTTQARSGACGGYCEKYLASEPPQPLHPSESSISRGEEKPIKELEKRYSDTLEPPNTTPFSLLKKPKLSYEEIQQKYKEGEKLINEKPYVMYQHPTDRAIMTGIKKLKRTKSPSQENEKNRASTSSQHNDKQSYQEKNDERYQPSAYFAQEFPSTVVNPMRKSVGEQSILIEKPLPFDRHSDSKAQNSIIEEEKNSRGNESLMNDAASIERIKNIESTASSSSEVTPDTRLPQKESSITEDTTKKCLNHCCCCEENTIPRKQQNTAIQRGSDYSKYGNPKETIANKLMDDENFQPCFCDRNKDKSRSMQCQESAMKEEKIDAYTQVVHQLDTQPNEYKTDERPSAVSAVSFGKTSFNSPNSKTQQSSPIVVPPQEFSSTMKFDPNETYMYPQLQTSNISHQFGPDQSAWRLPYSGARPEWKIIAPAQILRSSQFRSTLPINNTPQYCGNSGWSLPQMVNRSQLTLHKVLNPPYLQQPSCLQPNIGCCTSKFSISTKGIEYHHRSARCSMSGLQNRPSQNLHPSMSFGGMPISGLPPAGIESSNISHGVLPSTAMGSSGMTQIAAPVIRTDHAMMSGASHMGEPSATNGMYPVQESQERAPMEQMPYAFFPWAHRESQHVRTISNPNKLDSVPTDTNFVSQAPHPSFVSNLSQDFSRPAMIDPGSYLQQERNNQTGYNSQGTSYYQPESYYPPQKSLSSSASPYFSRGYSTECINKLKCRDPYCNQKPEIQPSPMPVPSASFCDPYRNMRESQPLSYDAANNICRPPSSCSTLTPKMVSCSPAKSCISLHDKGIICSALGPIRICARDPQAGISCGPKRSVSNVSREGSMHRSRSTVHSNVDRRSARCHRPTVESVMDNIMSNVAKKASRRGRDHGSRVPHTIREDNEDYRHSSARKSSSRGRFSGTNRGSYKSWRGHGSSMQGYEHRGSGRRSTRPHLSFFERNVSYDKHTSSMMDRMPSQMDYGGSLSSRGTSPGLGERSPVSPPNVSMRRSQGFGSYSQGRSFSRGTQPNLSRTSRGTSPGLQGRLFGSRASRGRSQMGPGGSRSGAEINVKRSRTSRGTSPGLGSKSFTGGSQSRPIRSESTGSNGTIPMTRQSGQQPPSQISNLPSRESIRFADRNSKYMPEQPPEENKRVSRKSDLQEDAFNPNSITESVKQEANAMKHGPGYTRTKEQTAHELQKMESGDDEITPVSNKPATMNQKIIAQTPANNKSTIKGGGGDQGRASKNKSAITDDKPPCPARKPKSNPEVANQRQSQKQKQQQQQRGSQPPSQQRGSQPPSQQRPRQTTDEGTQMHEGGNTRRSTRESQKRPTNRISQNRRSQRESERHSKYSNMSVPGDGMHRDTSNENIYTRYL